MRKIKFVVPEDIANSPTFDERIKSLEQLAKGECESLNFDWVQFTWGSEKDEHGDDRLILHACLGKTEEMGEGRIELPQAALNDEVLFRSKFHELIEAAEHLHNWRTALEQFYQQSEAWLSRRTPPPLVSRSGIRLFEERSGDYDTPTRSFTFGTREVTLWPVAAWVIGADGRVDLRGPGDRFILVLRGHNWFWVNEQAGGAEELVDEKLFNSLVDSALE